MSTWEKTEHKSTVTEGEGLQWRSPGGEAGTESEFAQPLAGGVGLGLGAAASPVEQGLLQQKIQQRQSGGGSVNVPSVPLRYLDAIQCFLGEGGASPGGTVPKNEPERVPPAPGPGTNSAGGPYPYLDAIQRFFERGGGAEPKNGLERVHEAAAHGTSGAAGRLPYLDEIQRSFGQHDVSHVKAHTDSQAARGAQAMGAEAFTTGEHVAFAGAPSLHTAAHEAAHVIQQRAGVQLKGGVGEVGDPYERHADAVADAVVQGKSSEALLDEYAGTGGSGRESLQLKPADIRHNFALTYGSDGTPTNASAARGTVSRAALINWRIREGWVTPAETLIGGHLFKREFGGPDDDTNVVPWKNEAEASFTDFEDAYSLAAKRVAPITATVTTEATFVDRPEFEVEDSELDAAGWAPTVPERDGRKDQFHKVAEHLSGIPNTVKVEVTGLPSGTRSFTATKAEIEPPFVKNPAALKPDFVPQKPVFTMSPGQPRVLKKANWTSSPPDKPQKKLQHEWRHAADFNLTGSWNKTNGPAFEDAIDKHIQASATTQILGTYRSTQNVLHYIDLSTNLWACTDESDGSLIAAWKLGQTQADLLLVSGIVK
jgi:hypothetical protein